MQLVAGESADVADRLRWIAGLFFDKARIGQFLDQFRQQARTHRRGALPRDVLQHQWQRGGFRDFAIVRPYLGRRRGVERRRQRHHGVGADRFGMRRELGGEAMMRGGNRNDRRSPAPGCADNDLGGAFAFGLTEIAAFARQRIGDDALCPGGEAELDGAGEPRLVEFERLGERRHDDNEDAAKAAAVQHLRAAASRAAARIPPCRRSTACWSPSTRRDSRASAAWRR